MSSPFGAKEYEESTEAIDILFEIAGLLNCGLDRQTLSILLSLIQQGVNPESLSMVVREIKRETLALKVAESQSKGVSSIPK